MKIERTSYFGVRRTPGVTATRKASALAWSSYFSIRGRCYFLGSFSTPEEAGHAWDNVAFWASKTKALGYKPKELNFPEHYVGENPPMPWKKSCQVLADLTEIGLVEKLPKGQQTLKEP